MVLCLGLDASLVLTVVLKIGVRLGLDAWCFRRGACRSVLDAGYDCACLGLLLCACCLALECLGRDACDACRLGLLVG